MTYLSLPGQIVKAPFEHVTEQEAMRIWAEARNPEIRCFTKCLWHTGLRISEVLRLKAGDLKRNGQEYSLNVTRSKKRKANAELLPICRELGQSLDDYRAGKKDNALLFNRHENTYRYELRICAKKAGLDNWQQIHPHAFRHGFVYYMARKGTHPYVLSRLTGHSSLAITMQYFSPGEADLRQALEK